VTAPKP